MAKKPFLLLIRAALQHNDRKKYKVNQQNLTWEIETPHTSGDVKKFVPFTLKSLAF